MDLFCDEGALENFGVKSPVVSRLVSEFQAGDVYILFIINNQLYAYLLIILRKKWISKHFPYNIHFLYFILGFMKKSSSTKHHDESHTFQEKYHYAVKKFYKSLSQHGNPFKNCSEELINIE